MYFSFYFTLVDDDYPQDKSAVLQESTQEIVPMEQQDSAALNTNLEITTERKESDTSKKRKKKVSLSNRDVLSKMVLFSKFQVIVGNVNLTKQILSHHLF